MRTNTSFTDGLGKLAPTANEKATAVTEDASANDQWAANLYDNVFLMEYDVSLIVKTHTFFK